jgi:FtsZ-binding cell division protein ZapB
MSNWCSLCAMTMPDPEVIDALQAEVAELKAQNSSIYNNFNKAYNEMVSLRAQLEELSKQEPVAWKETTWDGGAVEVVALYAKPQFPLHTTEEGEQIADLTRKLDIAVAALEVCANPAVATYWPHATAREALADITRTP